MRYPIFVTLLIFAVTVNPVDDIKLSSPPNFMAFLQIYSPLKTRLDVSDLALSKHRKVSKNANYLQLIKKTKFTRQRTWVSLTPRGRESFKLH
ncbi:MAG: transcriptional regulator [Porticoccaceae bacterium]|nr:transcriptional regulator [Porticoccaceae bacterium]